ncbi:sensor histidine kinase [Microbacterium sp.]|uniref:sensor histidine kinase n=1 Tax=Microbacterium sp. TaxID=51671 RepID=UPI003A924552
MTREPDETADRSAQAIRPAAGSVPGTWLAEPHGKQQRNHWDRFGWLMAVIWLVFLVYPVIALLNSEAPEGWVVVGWAAMVAFVGLYIVGFTRGIGSGGGLGHPPARGQWLFFAGLIACAAISIPAEGGSALSFLPFIMSFASYGLTRLAHWITLAASVAVTAGWVFLIPGGLNYLSVLFIVILLGVVNTVSTWLIIRSADAERLGLELATSEGREAVARDVHDLIGHSLTVVKMKAQLARRLIDADPARAKAELADIEALAAEAIAGVRTTVAGARAASLTEQLAASADALRSAGVVAHVDGDPGALSPAQGLTASWILREATTNILRHAGASAVTVTVRPGMLAVQDDGRGSGEREGNGVRGMRERAAAAGARFELTRPASGGTRVEVTW